jgi:hypothetical protein
MRVQLLDLIKQAKASRTRLAEALRPGQLTPEVAEELKTLREVLDQMHTILGKDKSRGD